MKSILFDAPGEPGDVLRSSETETPKPGPGEVLVRMLASPINPSDLMFVRGVYGIRPECPQSPGFEGVGVVEACGGGLRGMLFKGKRAVVMNSRGGNWAEYSVVPATQIIPVSSALSVDQAATFFVNPATAWILTQEVLSIPTGKWVLQTAAGSALGHMITRLGKLCKYRTLCVVRRERYRESLKRAGADAVIVFDPETDTFASFQEAVSEIVGKDGVGYAIDPVGGLSASAVIQVLGPGGRILLFGTLSDQPISFSPRTIMERGITVEGFWLGSFMNSRGLLFKLKLVRRITQLIRSGVLATEIAARFSFDQIAEAVRTAEDRDASGKALLSVTAIS